MEDYLRFHGLGLFRRSTTRAIVPIYGPGGDGGSISPVGRMPATGRARRAVPVMADGSGNVGQLHGALLFRAGGPRRVGRLHKGGGVMISASSKHPGPTVRAGCAVTVVPAGPAAEES